MITPCCLKRQRKFLDYDVLILFLLSLVLEISSPGLTLVLAMRVAANQMPQNVSWQARHFFEALVLNGVWVSYSAHMSQVSSRRGSPWIAESLSQDGGSHRPGSLEEQRDRVGMDL